MATPTKTPKTKVSRFFRVAVEGATTDGRKIERAHLEQMAQNYSRNTYSARISLEHYKGIDPEGLFKAYGDVAAVKTEEIEIAGKKKLALFAQIIPTAELIALNKKGQKLYTSIEINPEFADSGEAYLQGLAITDNPASLGTEALEFAAKTPAANPWATRKAEPGNVVTEALEFSLQLEDGEGDDGAGLLDKFRSTLATAVAKFSRKGDTDDARFAAVAESLVEMGEAFGAHVTDTTAQQATDRTEIKALRTALDGMQEKFAAMENEPSGTRRPLANGGDASAVATDC